MIRSMTAYASRSLATGHGQLTWELRSVNQRYLDLSLRLPEEFRTLEPDIRSHLKAQLTRGKIEASLRFQPDPAAIGAGLKLNKALCESLLAVHEELSELSRESRGPDLVALMQWPNLIVEERPDLAEERRSALELLDATIEDLVAGREQEGRAIAAMLETRIASVEGQISRVRGQLPDIREALKARFHERLASLGENLEPGRLEAEVVLQLHKLDVDEELDRLTTHVAEVQRVLGLDEPVGRRLDFLMQELNREANTLGSKATVAETTQAAVELKVLIEQMREQVQNVE